MNDPIFLALDQILELHARQIQQFGGADGVRDIQLVESAAAQPRQASGGQYLHKTLAEMAAAYLFHLVRNHGFVDGNKRIGSAAALVFLEMNGIDSRSIDEKEMEQITRAVAEGKANKQAALDFFRARISENED